MGGALGIEGHTDTPCNHCTLTNSTMTTMFLFFVALAIVTSFVLNHTMFGRALYAIGGNEVSAERAGYNVKRVKFILYSVVGAVSRLLS